jgi:FkbM family methyltransferase
LAGENDVISETQKVISDKLNELESKLNHQEELKHHITSTNLRFESIEKQLQALAGENDVISETQKVISDKLNELESKLNKYDELIEINEEKSFFEKQTFSQSGEDSILAYICHVLGVPFNSVTYVDLGANHAKELSNTYFFYKQGGRGVLVEANPQLIPELKFYRNRDIILNRCIHSESGKTVDFYILSGDGLSTPDYTAAVKFSEANPNIKIVDKVQIKTITYNEIVEHYLGKAPTILSIDIEGNDMDILSSIDYEKYRPMLIIVEMIQYGIKLNYQTKNENIKRFLESKGYDEYAFTGINSIFLDKNVLN